MAAIPDCVFSFYLEQNRKGPPPIGTARRVLFRFFQCGGLLEICFQVGKLLLKLCRNLIAEFRIEFGNALRFLVPETLVNVQHALQRINGYLALKAFNVDILRIRDIADRRFDRVYLFIRNDFPA